MSDLFTRAELLALPATDLSDLVKLAPGETVEQQCRALGLDLSDPIDRLAAEAALATRESAGYPTTPAVHAAQPGVRSDLTPEPPAPDDPDTGEGDDLAEALGLPEPSEAAAADMADLLARSAASGHPFMAGTFALYATPEGGVVLVTQDPDGEVKRSVIPRKLVRLALGLMAGKSPGGMMGRLFMGKRGRG